jgi:hypothetical protein
MKGSRIAAALTVALGCGSPELEVTFHSVRDSAGFEIVENENHPATVELGARVHRIGGVEGPGSLYQVRHVFLAPDGDVAVVESSTNSIKFFGRDGSQIRSLGGTGRGPGEFRGLWYASLAPADTIIAFDITTSSVSVFDPAGTFVRSFTIPHVGRGELVAIDSWPSGALLVLMQSTDTQLDIGETYRWGLYNVGRDGSVASDLGRWPMGVYRGGRELFAHRAAFASADTALLYSPGDRFEVRSYDPSGSLRRITRVARPRRPVSDSDVATYWADLRSRAPNEETFALWRLRLGDPLVADSMPAYADLLALEHQAFLARRSSLPTDSSTIWDVFSASGVFLGALELPPRFRLVNVTERYLAGVALDENDVEFVDVYEWTLPLEVAIPGSGVHSR